MEQGSVVGLIAGAGRLPEILAEAIKARGHRLVWLAVGPDSAARSAIADYTYELQFGKLAEVPMILMTHQVRHVLLAGRVPRAVLLGGSDDPTLRQELHRLGDRRDHVVLHHIAHLLGQIGVTVISPLQFVAELAIAPGVHTRRVPTEAEWEDIRFGMPVARAIAALDVGQTVVVKDGVILAVEAAEGTDLTIQRAGGMAEGIRVIKAARPRQDDRFDLPTIGTQTIHVLADAHASVLAVEAHKTLLLDRQQTMAAADAVGIAVVAVEPVSSQQMADPPPPS